MKNALLVCATLMSFGAYADPAAIGGPTTLRAIDTDADGLISLAEAQAGAPDLAAHFNELDANQDGMLSIDEIAAHQPMGNVRFTRDLDADFTAADVDGDGKLSRAEAAAKMPLVNDFFGEMDADADGYVTRDEIRAHARKHGGVRFVTEPMTVPTGR